MPARHAPSPSRAGPPARTYSVVNVRALRRHRAPDRERWPALVFPKRSFGTTLVTVVGVIAVLVGACGAKGSARGGTAAGVCSPGVTDRQVRVGVLYPDSGPAAAPYRGFRAGVEARVAKENAAGGVAGRRITTVWRDDASSASVNLSAAKNLAAEGAFAILEHTAFSEQSAPWLDEQGIPVLGVADQPLWGDHANMFAYSAVSDDVETTATLG
ncbi:ABC transporter substrate-binding protein, partial [Frankia sp. EI5c]|uniref:ABC transporter substrate-binding protein n=1 Tax=Frankia sp. EI5c TaxID=683316 RepID=UPI001F5B5E83